MRLDVTWRFWLAVGLQLSILLGLAGWKQQTVWTGQTIRLQTAPVDPRSLFRGDYVILHYPFSSLDPHLVADGASVAQGDTVYVVLAGSDGNWHARSVHKQRLEAAPGEVVLRGTVQRPTWSGGGLDVAYGIESYFVPEGSGWPVTRAGVLEVDVAIDGWGRGVVRRLLVDGVPFEPR